MHIYQFLITSFLFQWRYTIRLENLGSETVQLRHRSWKIYPKPGAPIRKIGRGVVGEVC